MSASELFMDGLGFAFNYSILDVAVALEIKQLTPNPLKSLNRYPSILLTMNPQNTNNKPQSDCTEN